MPELNPQQKAAVQYINGPLLVLAGAGSGKTSLLSHKITWLLRDFGFEARQIVTITATQKAARALKARVADIMKGDTSKDLPVSTFYTLGLNILRAHLGEIDYREGISLYDAEDTTHLLTKLLRHQTPVGKSSPVEAVRRQISLWKCGLISPAEAPLSAGGESVEDVAARVYGEYERHLQSYNAMDLDDLVLKPVRLFQQRGDILDEWRRRIRYLLIDDYQDTSLAQHEFVKLLAAERGSFTATGDDDQCIGSDRGARPRHLKLLQQDFSQLKTIRLEQNFRSTGRILKSANALIANNPHVFEKSLWCDRDYGTPLRVLRTRSDEHEAERVVSELLNHKINHNGDFRDYAILYRDSHQSRVFERVLRERRIPYFLNGGTSFFDKTEIKDVMAYLRLLCNPGDDNAFLRVINTPRRDIVPATLEQLAAHAAETNSSLLQASMDPAIDQRLTVRQEVTLRGFTRWLMEMINKSEDDEPAKLVSDMLADLHYEEWLRDTCNDHKIAQRRMENVLELMVRIQRLARQEEQKTLSDLVAQLTLMGILDKDNEENPGDFVSLMTIPAARGLEFPHVFLVGMEEGLLPSAMTEEDSAIAEERRLAYVGMTRACQTLTFSFSDRRKRGGEIVNCEASRFLKELPPDDLSWEELDQESDTRAMLGRADVYLANLRDMLGGP